MRVSFDLDDTLICGPGTPREPALSLPLRWLFREPIRAGAPGLMRELREQGCTLWIYTTSLRRPWHIRLWFLAMGIRLEGVVNQDVHRAMIRRSAQWTGAGSPPSKYPPAFDIVLHVDDSEGVAWEGTRHDFAVLVVSPDDLAWTDHVRAEFARLGVRP